MDQVQECLSSETLSKKARTDDEEEADEIRRPIELFPHEIVLSFDHILEQIFSFLSSPDLLTCRLVSHRFLKFAQVPLGEKIEFVFIKHELQLSGYSRFGMKMPSGRTLDQLIDFLKSSPSSPESSTSIAFPCTRFNFEQSRLGDNVLQRFLNIHGENIKDLSVAPFPRADTTHENILMDQLSQLLRFQAPYLEHLSLQCLHPIVEWQLDEPIENQGIFGNSPKRSIHSPLLKTDPELQQIVSRVEYLGKKSCLKVLSIDGYGLAKVMEFIFQISPKLQKVQVHEDFYIYLLQPVSRVYLQKYLKITPKIDYPTTGSMETIEKMSMQNSLELKQLDLDFETVSPVCKTNLEFEKRLVSIVNRILEHSRNTLECFSFYEMTFLRGIKFPTCMPRVRTILIMEQDKILDTKAAVFREGFLSTLSKTFPKLTCLKVHHFGEFITPAEVYEFFKCWGIEEDDDPTVSLNVKEVQLTAFCEDEPDVQECTRIRELVSRKVLKFFPNAQISFRC